MPSGAKVLPPSKKEIEESRRRAEQWRRFRAEFLYSQQDLAAELQCSRRTVVAVEQAETVRPRATLLRKFRALRQKHEKLYGSEVA